MLRTRHKISDDFYLDEFICPEWYNLLINYPNPVERMLALLDPNLVGVVQAVRTEADEAVTLNNWGVGGSYRYSGLRPYDCKEGAKASWHKGGFCADLKFATLSTAEVLNIIEKKYSIFKVLGLTLIEDIRYTKSKRKGGRDWLHLSTQPTYQNKLKIMIP